jgi:GTP-binding protein
MSKPIVAVVGRPNVGKSTLFNKLCGQRLAIVEDTPGITRDRIFANCEWSGHEFLLVDTGGIEPKATEGILAHMREQAQIAIDTADCIIMVVDVRNGLTAADEDVAHMLRRSHKPIILAVNKCDNVGETPMELYEFYNLGFDEVMPISSVHGHGTGDLLDAVCAHLDFSETVVEEDRIPVAIIGRPNVGKSSLTNRILGENRMIVANEAGTTRDAIDTPVDNAYGKFIFTDTAGLRKRSNITDGLERYMVVRALAAVERSRVALILVDATVGFTEQDSKVAGYAHDQGKACIIVVNKWDAVVGHSKPIYFGFKGGKGVLVAAGAILAVQPVLLPVLALIFLVCLVPTGMVSLGSITMAAAYPVLTLVYSLMRGLPTRDVVVCTVGAAIMGGMVIWMHRSNIQRIRDGKEYRFGQKHKSN